MLQKTPGGTVPKKRKKSEHEDNTSKCKKCVSQGKQEAATNVRMIICTII